MPSYIKWIIIFLVVLFNVVVLIWFCKTRCTRKQNVDARRIGHPTPSVTGTNLNQHTLYPPAPTQFGFGNPVDKPRTQLYTGKVYSFRRCGLADTFPPPGGVQYRLQFEDNRPPYPTGTSCYPPAHTAPYPVTDSMPQPSTSTISQLSNSTIITPYPPAHQTPYPATYSMPQPSTSRIYDLSNSTRNKPYTSTDRAPYSPPASSAPYPPANSASYPPASSAPYPPASNAPYPPASSASYRPASSAPYPPASNAPYSNASGAPYPPASSASFSSELPPPAYEDAVNKKF